MFQAGFASASPGKWGWSQGVDKFLAGFGLFTGLGQCWRPSESGSLGWLARTGRASRSLEQGGIESAVLEEGPTSVSMTMGLFGAAASACSAVLTAAFGILQLQVHIGQVVEQLGIRRALLDGGFVSVRARR